MKYKCRFCDRMFNSPLGKRLHEDCKHKKRLAKLSPKEIKRRQNQTNLLKLNNDR